MQRLFSRILLVLALLGLSCSSSSVKRHRPAGKPKPVALSVWIHPDAGFSKLDTLIACDEWAAKGVSCYIVPRRSQADVRIYADHEDKCKRDKEGRRTLAMAWQGGKIVFYTRCFSRSSGKFNTHMYRAIATHEIGHQLGIWGHIPEDCSGKAKKHPSGQKICGRAIMNPLYDAAVYFITPIDSLAFDIRDRSKSVVVDPETADEYSGVPDCVYYAK